MSVEHETEIILSDYIIKMLSVSAMKSICNGSDVLNSLSMDAEEEVKNEVWELVKQNLNYSNIVYKVKDYLRNSYESGSDTDEEEEKEINNSEDNESEENSDED